MSLVEQTCQAFTIDSCVSTLTCFFGHSSDYQTAVLCGKPAFDCVERLGENFYLCAEHSGLESRVRPNVLHHAWKRNP